MDNSHSNIVICDLATSISHLFIELVSSIDHCSHKTIEIVVIRESDILIFVSGVEFGDCTLRFIQCLQGTVQFQSMASSMWQDSLFDFITESEPNSSVSTMVFINP